MIDSRPRNQSTWLRLLAGGLFVAAVVFAYVQYRDVLSLASLAEHEDSLRHRLASTPATKAVAALLLFSIFPLAAKFLAKRLRPSSNHQYNPSVADDSNPQPVTTLEQA